MANLDNVHLTCVGYLAMALAIITEVLAIQNGV